ncbi:hypothetical protein A3G67_03435 [Candidatus Roizmanbacteria bacterium RIFCSPLOWO2_12_FULL_40_12]|uniref:Elongation factor Ts n=1 Tax=Candidatus Roizmanbacteria bacterium RIFCSPLOWO2_01_FULL_40_42 TaxID=1802066 RepID=A0A1F7J5K5_9BACT|nr:MAG: hypothetical protein A2779_03070 [Candidatus Roizmanbacteria bacterium RIFCSPHIGHO2_01_FULL_40_98]OGK28323.1 MAG: hypothetical protein A3C31_00435 [Candidatus Roizmanbacteria bacterium RIFCSPHIGHO2_02_FULL_40_53]OGK30559.1 MAG: hypothetical protein A2W49_03120 [Candidatus Roizmanbacteria bacterium RIFCSPHIGHO2_12_41_18]OGK36973.1 MAG: hypothetical protein A3E69_00695 [Candidatus Roizmanbacteria bacterium RIFCSPHIGHO2_12_FULL_40_130]OGK50879.1 MAG: hypothetical protein A3B50_01205 [Candi
MSKVDFAKLKKLREETGISFSLCKKALEESDNNIEEAKKKLTKWGAGKVKEKSGKSTSEGALFSYVHHNKKVMAVVEIQCETDFVSGNKEFQQVGQELAMQIASTNPSDMDDLLSQDYNRDPSKKVKDLLNELVLKIGENIKIARFMRWELGQK